MQGWLKKAQTGVARAKQQAMAKMGRADETVDVTFNQVSQQFKENHEKLKRQAQSLSVGCPCLKHHSVRVGTDSVSMCTAMKML